MEGISPAKKISLTPTSVSLKLSSSSSSPTPRRVIKVKRAAVASIPQGTAQDDSSVALSSSSFSSSSTSRAKITWP